MIPIPRVQFEESLNEVAKIVRRKVKVTPIPRSRLLSKLYGRHEAKMGAKEAIINEECPKCKHPQLSYHTAQLRGLDEGQTIFYTCLNENCKHKYTMNS